MKVTFEHSAPEAKNIRTFYFRPPKPVRYTAGQFIELTLPHDQPDERGIKHWFTLSSSPIEELLSITTKFDPVHSSTFKQTLFSLKPKQVVAMADPMGDFVLPKDKSRPLIFIAGGMGITPMRSMIKWLDDTQEHRIIHLIYGVSEPSQFIFRELFAKYGLPVTLNLSQPFPGWPSSRLPSSPPLADKTSRPLGRDSLESSLLGWQGESGPLTAQRILGMEPNVDNKLYFMSGPEPMIEVLYKDFKDLGVKESQIVTDYFPGYPPI